MHVALVTPVHQILALKVGFSEFLVARLVIGVPGVQLGLGHSRRWTKLHVQFGKGFGNGHVLRVLCFATAGIVVKQGLRFGELPIPVPAKVFQIGRPLAMRRLMLAHQQEGFGFVTLLEPVERQISDNVRDIASRFYLFSHSNHRRVIVNPLAGKNLPKIKTRGIADKMPFADHRRLVPGLLQQFWHRLLGTIETAAGIVVKAIHVAVFAGQHTSAAWPADRVGNQGAIKNHPLAGQPVDVRRLVELPGVAICANGLISMIVRKDKKNIGLARGSGQSRQRQSDETDEQCTNG